MATETTISSPETVAELVENLGGIPLERIRIKPPLGMAKERDVLRLRGTIERRLSELIDGVLVEIAYDLRASVLDGALISKLMNVVEESDNGIVLGSTAFVRFRPGLIRIPGVAFYAWERFPRGRLPDVEILTAVPDLAIDVFRRGNTEAELQRKRRDYFEAGVRQVWLIRPESKTAEVFRSPTKRTLIPPEGALAGGKIVPGFSLLLTELFGYLRRRG